MRRFVVALLSVLWPLAAAAGDEAGHWFFTPFVGGIYPDSKRDTDGNAFDYGAGFGKQLTDSWALELYFNRSSLRNKFDDDHTTLSQLNLDVLHIWNRRSTFAPYVQVGAGWLQVSEHGYPNGSYFNAEGGVGAFIKLWENADGSRSFSLRPDVRARWDHQGTGGVVPITRSGDMVDLIYTLGFTLSFGPPVPAPAPVAAAAVVAVPVAAAPAAAPPPPPPPADVVLHGVEFATDSATLTAGSKPVLDNVAAELKQNPGMKVELQGHTDSTGSAPHNLELSQRRAEAVRDYLVGAGVPAAQLTARGYGQSQPIASNATAEGRAENRRTVMRVLENPGGVPVRGEGQPQ